MGSGGLILTGLIVRLDLKRLLYPQGFMGRSIKEFRSFLYMSLRQPNPLSTKHLTWTKSAPKLFVI